jgi:XXXCH domain-containing protein
MNDRGADMHRHKRELDHGEAAAYLRELADSIDRGEVSADGAPGLGLSGRVEIKESLRLKPGASRLKVKLEIGLQAPEGLLAPRPGEARPSYKRLKKRMKRDFRGLRAAVGAGDMPAELIRAFHVDCREMTRYPGKGDPLYPEFNAAAEALAAAADRRDNAAACEALRRLDALRREGHARYK